MIPLGESIKQWRRHRGLSMSDLARFADVGLSRLSRLESGRVESLAWPAVSRLCRVLYLTTFEELEDGCAVPVTERTTS